MVHCSFFNSAVQLDSATVWTIYCTKQRGYSLTPSSLLLTSFSQHSGMTDSFDGRLIDPSIARARSQRHYFGSPWSWKGIITPNCPVSTNNDHLQAPFTIYTRRRASTASRTERLGIGYFAIYGSLYYTRTFLHEEPSMSSPSHLHLSTSLTQIRAPLIDFPRTR